MDMEMDMADLGWDGVGTDWISLREEKEKRFLCTNLTYLIDFIPLTPSYPSCLHIYYYLCTHPTPFLAHLVDLM